MDSDQNDTIKRIAQLIRYWILTMSTEAGSGHPSSSLSAVELMATLFFGGFFRFRVGDPDYTNNDRLIFSKGHASPLFYGLWAAAGGMKTDELLTFRKMGSRLEGHPTRAFPFTEAPTGSLGQGLSIGVGMALAAQRLDRRSYRTFVLLGDSEMAEGSVWEALGVAAYYNLSSLVGILDVNRLGQRGETMLGDHCETYEKRIQAFGWATRIVDGYDIGAIADAYAWAESVTDRPVMVIAKTVKGKGVSFIEDKDGWHGKPLSREECAAAIAELGSVDQAMRGILAIPAGASSNLYIGCPDDAKEFSSNGHSNECAFPEGSIVSTRKSYGMALSRIAQQYPDIVVLDAEVSNSTFADIFKKDHPERFFEMFVAEQNMAGCAVGLARRGKHPFVSTFAAFLTRAADQIRMAQYADVNIVFCGSHAGVSIGEDGASQMGLEDLALFRTLLGSTVLYPSDAVCCSRLVEEAARTKGLIYLRTTRKDLPLLYPLSEQFPVGGSKTLRSSANDRATIVAAGITVYEALKAQDLLAQEGTAVRVIDAYSVKPIDRDTLVKAARETGHIIIVEDHAKEGGLGEAVLSALAGERVPVTQLAVTKRPVSGKPDELLAFEEIDAEAIVKAVLKGTSNE